MKRKAIVAAVAATFSHATWAGINDGGNTANLPTGGIANSATNVTSSSVSGNVMSLGISGKAIIDWSTFNIGSGFTLNFNGSQGAVLNRVPGGNPANASSIAGNLNGSNLAVMLMNPNGIAFTSTAVVNVGALVATTGTIDQNTFLATGNAAISGAVGSITNHGQIIALGHQLTASNAGLVALVAPSVANHNVITATGGKILLAGADAATITMNNGLYEFAVTGHGTNVTNAAGASLNGATLYLSTGDAAHLLSETINLSGVQQATSAIVVNGGTVVLTSDLSAPLVSGNSSRIEVRGAGAAPANAPHIQDAVDIAQAGATIDVYGGSYTEGHANVDYFGAAGGGQNFGLHVYKDGLRIRGLKPSGAALSGLDDADMPVVTAQYQTGFGAQHFISGSGVTLEGLKFKPVSSGTNKTLEVIGNDFTLKNSVIDNSGNATAAALYISDFAIDGRPEVESFRLENNRFIAGTTASALVVVASGAGNSTPASNRIFRNNQLLGNPALSGARGFQVQGQMTGIPWQPFTAGAVTVEGNTFSGFDAPVRTVGLMTEPLDWNAIFNGNTFVGGAALAFVGDTTTARAGTVAVAAQDGTGGSSDITDTRITRKIQASIDRAQSADTVRALAGTYAETLSITKALTLKGAGKGSTIIDPAGSSGTGILVSGNIGAGATVAIRDLTVQGGAIGIQVSDTATTLGTITLDGLAVLDNSSQGFISSNGGSNPTAVANINILNSVFAGNGVGPGSADINLFRFNGNATIKNVDILGTRGSASNLAAATDYGLQIRGHGEVSNMTAAGVVKLENVRIAGNYRRAHLGIQRYSDASNIAMSGVQLGGALSGISLGNNQTVSVASSSAGFGKFFSSDQGGALSLGDTTFLGSTGDANALDVSIGGSTSGMRIDATGTRFLDEDGVQRSDNFAIERRVQHAMDADPLGGVVTWQAGNLFVTSDRSIQRGINVALAGETINVAAASFAEDVVVNQQRNLVFNGSTVRSLTIGDCACGSGIGGTVTASTAAGFAFNAPVVLLKDTVLDTSAAGGSVSAVAINGTTAGGQKLTVRSGAGAVTLGNLGATTRLGTVDVSGAIRFTGSTYFANSLLFAGPMMLDTPGATFRTSGGNIVLDGDMQSPGGSALTLDAGLGDVTMVSGGSSGNPLGRLQVDANNFTLQGTLWVSGYDINALGTVALSNSTLRSVGGSGTDAIDAGGDVTGSTISESRVQIDAGGDVAANVAALGEVVVEATNISGTYVAPTITFQAAETINVTVDTPGPVQVKSPGGFVDGNYGELINTGDGLINANGRPQVNVTLAETASNNRVVPQEVTTAASPEASAPQRGGSTVRRRRKPEDALDVLDNGEAMEIDLTPG